MRHPVSLIRTVLVCTLAAAIGGGNAVHAQGQNPSMADDQYLFANELFDRKLYELAIQEYEKFVQEYPQHKNVHQARLRIGEAYLRLRRYPESIAAYQRALEAKPDSKFRGHALVGMGLAYFYSNQFEKGIATLLEARPLVADDAELGPIANTWLGECYYNLQRYDEAAACFQIVLDRWADREEQAAQAAYALGFCHQARKNLAQAAAQWLQMAEKYPKHPLAVESLLRAGEALTQAEQYPMAAQAYQKVLTEYRENPRALAAAQMGLGWVAFYQKRYAEARAAFELVEKNYKEFAPAAPLVAMVPMRVADCYYYEGKYEEASRGYEVGTQHADPAVRRESLYWLGMCRLQLAQASQSAMWEQAVVAFQRVADDPEAGTLGLRAKLRLADLRLDRDPAGAGMLYQQVLASNPDDTLLRDQAQYGLAVALFRQAGQGAENRDARLAEAEAQFTAIVRRDPNSPLAPLAVIGMAQCQLERWSAIGAISQLEELLKKDLPAETRAAALLVLGQAHLALKSDRQHLESAVRVFRQILDQHPDSNQAPTAAAALVPLLRDLQRRQEADEIERLLLQKYGSRPSAVDALIANAELQREQGNHTGAIQIYEQLASRDNLGQRIWNVRMGLALCYAATGQTAKLNQVLQLLEKGPGDTLATTHYRIAAVYERANKPEEALAAYQAVLRAGPPEALAASARLRIGVVLAGQKRYAEAAAAFQEVLDKHSRTAAAPQALYELAWLQVDSGKPAAEARPYFERLVRDFPDHPLATDALFRIAEQDYAAKQYAAAADGYRKVLAARTVGDLADKAWYKLGWALREQRDWAGAAQAFLAVATQFPTSPLADECRLRAGEALLEQKQYGPATEQLQPVATRRPRNDDERWLVAQARVALARAQFEQGQFEQAAETARPAVAAANGIVGAQAALLVADSLFERKQYTEARSAYLRVVVLFKSHRALAAKAQYQLGECYARLNQMSDARTAWEECTRAFPGSEWAARATERLGQTRPAGGGN